MSFKEDGLIVLSVSPGVSLIQALVLCQITDKSLQYIKTAMGDMEDGDLTPAQSAQAVLRRASDATLEDSGHFVDIEEPGFSRPDGVPKYTGACLPY